MGWRYDWYCLLILPLVPALLSCSSSKDDGPDIVHSKFQVTLPEQIHFSGQSNLHRIKTFVDAMYYPDIETDIKLKGQVKGISFNRISLGDTDKNSKPMDDILSNIEDYEIEEMFKFWYSRSGFRTRYMDIRRTTVEEPGIIITFRYDEKGRLEKVSIIWDDEKKEYDSLVHIQYDSDGHLGVIEDRNRSGILEEKKLLFYDRLLNFRVVGEFSCLAEALSCSQQSYVLDAEGRVIEEFGTARTCKHLGYKKVIMWSTFHYNEDGTLAEEHTHDKDGSAYLAKAYTYNSHGDLIRSTEYEPNGDVVQLRTNEYIYDEKGNWVKNLAKNEHIEGDVKVWDQRWLFMREIEYYDGN